MTMRRLGMTHPGTPCKAKQETGLSGGRQLLQAAQAVLAADTYTCRHLEYAANFTLHPAMLLRHLSCQECHVMSVCLFCIDGSLIGYQANSFKQEQFHLRLAQPHAKLGRAISCN